MDKKILILSISGALLVLVIGLIIFLGRVPFTPTINADLTMLGVFDDENIWDDMIYEFNGINKNIQIDYQQLPIDTYESAILDRLASQQPLDLFMVHSSWMPRYATKVLPVGEINLSLKQFKDSFADVAVQDFVSSDNQILGVPFYGDTLALYYNKTMFNESGIAKPPKTWEEFMQDVEKLTVKDEQGNVLVAGAAIGTGANINRAPDILSVLMMQTGTKMTNEDNTEATFNRLVDYQNSYFDAGQDALRFYTDFANPQKKSYTWGASKSFSYSIDAFAYARAAMLLNYQYNRSVIDDKAPNLKYDVVNLPQISSSGVVNYASYFGLAMPKTISQASQEAAEIFLTWLATDEAQAKYMELSGKPPINKSQIALASDDLDLSVFATQILTARSWFEVDNRQVDSEFINMIESVVMGKRTLKDALDESADRLTFLMRQRNEQ